MQSFIVLPSLVSELAGRGGGGGGKKHLSPLKVKSQFLKFINFRKRNLFHRSYKKVTNGTG